MKKLLFWLTLPILLVGCTADLESRMDGFEDRLSKLETLCNQMNTNISSLQTLVTALQNNDYVTSVTSVTQGGEEIGYTISFSKSKSITIYHGKNGIDGKDGINGTNGKDGQTPVIGVKKDSDGLYYWTLNGEWLRDGSGNKIRAIGTDGQNGADGKDGQNGTNGQDGITPQLKVVDGYWQISYDNGKTWSQIGQATGNDGKDGKDGDSFFQSVDTSDPAFVTFTLADGTIIKMPTWASFEELQTLCNQMNTNIGSLQTIVNALQEKDFVTSVAPLMDNGKEVGYTITFSKSGSVNIYHGKDGEAGTNGTTPVIGVKADTDGIYYWTLNGEWLLDDADKKVKASASTGESGTPGTPGANGITPKLKIESGYWYVSYDEGETWTQLGKATGEDGQPGAPGTPGADGDSFFQSVDTSNPRIIVFVLKNGTRIEVPRASGLVSQIQSIVYIPMFDDGKAYIDTDRKLELIFFISPSDVAQTIAASWSDVLSLEAIYSTKTRAIVDVITLNIESVQEENGYIKVQASAQNLGEAFFSGINGASVCLKIKENGVSLSSESIPLGLLGETPSITRDLSLSGTANSYIVSTAGTYKFKAVKGNSTESVGSVASVEVLWETFGTDTAPAVGDLVKNVSYSDGYITFDATNKKGNASIAAKDASGKILWSWHIWLTNQPEEQVYYNNAGTMMDRNLGATSANPGEVQALGLLYQWGRKDPFLGGSAISYSSSSNQAKAASTLTWPAAVTSDSSNGTIAYAQANPTTFIKYNSSNYDWYYTGSSSTDNTRWQSTKTIYDPCPPGWRVPDGGSNGVWSKACGSSNYFEGYPFDSTTKGMNFSGKFGDSSMIWYPTAGCLSYRSGQLYGVGGNGDGWSVAPDSGGAYGLNFDGDGYVNPSGNFNRAYGRSVRCLQE